MGAPLEMPLRLELVVEAPRIEEGVVASSGEIGNCNGNEDGHPWGLDDELDGEWSFP